jgi:hypothetical protein
MRFGFAVRGIAVMVCSERRRMGSLVLLDLLGGVTLLRSRRRRCTSTS